VVPSDPRRNEAAINIYALRYYRNTGLAGSATKFLISTRVGEMLELVSKEMSRGTANSII
jgi:hypothetical protein